MLLITNTASGAANAFNKNIFRAPANTVIDLNGRLEQSPAGRLIAADGGLIEFRQAMLTGGSIETEGAGVAEVSNLSVFVDVTNKGTLNILSGGSSALLTVRGSSFVNDGVVTINSDGTIFGARVIFEESVDMSGAGEMIVGGAGPGSLSIAAGKELTQQAGHAIKGRGQLLGTSGVLVNHGTLSGASNSEMMDVDVILQETGLLRDLFIDGIHAPGDPNGSPTAAVSLEGAYSFGNGPGINGANRLEIEIGGVTPGAEYDQLVSTDVNNSVTINPFRTELEVSLIDLNNGYVPAAGQRFTIIDSTNDILGMFDDVVLPETGLGRSLQWAPVDLSDPTKLVLEIVAADFLEADFDEDSDVDQVDLDIWQAAYGASDLGDADGDGGSTGRDLLIWQHQYGSGVLLTPAAAVLPEPAALLLLTGCTVLAGGAPRRRCRAMLL